MVHALLLLLMDRSCYCVIRTYELANRLTLFADVPDYVIS